MRVSSRALLIITAITLLLIIPSATIAQHKHPQGGLPKAGMAGMHALLTQLGMMSKMNGGRKAANKKMAMKKM